MRGIDYTVPAEIFGGSGPSRRLQRLSYRRFETLAEALKFAVELHPKALAYTSIEIDGSRLTGKEIRELYESEDFPLERSRPTPK